MTVRDNITNTTSTTITIDTTEDTTEELSNSTNCLVCGMNISLPWYSNTPKICDDCRRAIILIKERFKGEYDA